MDGPNARKLIKDGPDGNPVAIYPNQGLKREALTEDLQTSWATAGRHIARVTVPRA